MCDPGWSADFKQLELCGAVVRSYFQLLLNILKPVPIHFCCFRESCNAVLLQSSRSDLWFMKLHPTLHANDQLVMLMLICTEVAAEQADRLQPCDRSEAKLCTHKAFIKKCQLCLSCQLCFIQIRERLRPSAA